MIALLLAVQLSGAAIAVPRVQDFGAPPLFRSSDIIKSLPRKAVCKNELGRMEVSLAMPTALYRQGDRPVKGLRKWADYPDGVLCAVEDAK